MALKADELARKLYHVAAGGMAFLFRFLTWRQAIILAVSAVLVNVFVVPYMGGRRWFWRTKERENGYSHGILLYTISVLVLVLVFRDALWMSASIWGVLAFGDGMSGIVGEAYGGPKLPWNERKSWAGSAAFVFFGGLAAVALMLWTAPASIMPVSRAFLMGIPLALACALVESVPSRFDDNVTIPLVGGLVLPLLALSLVP